MDHVPHSPRRRPYGLDRHPSIVQLASRDLVTWEHLGPIDLDSPRVIDAAVAPCGDGRHRLWYKDEARGSNTYSAVTSTPADPTSWVLEGLAIPGRPHEGPKVKLGGQFWMIVDEWRGQAVYRSEDASGGWTRQEYLDGLILTAPETADGGPVVGRHADVVPLEATADGKETGAHLVFHPSALERRGYRRHDSGPQEPPQPHSGGSPGSSQRRPGLY